MRDQRKICVGSAKSPRQPLPEARAGGAVMGAVLSKLQESLAASVGEATKIKPESPALAGGFFTTSTTWEALYQHGSVMGSFQSSCMPQGN